MPEIWVVIVLIFGVINMINKANKQKQAQQNHAAKAQPARQNQTSSPKPPQQAPAPVPAFHETRPLEAHMHEPQMGVEGEGTEGEDCCHEYMLSDTPQPETADILPVKDQGEGDMAKALLQGVIFSEVLGRRPMRRYGGRRA